MKILELNEGKVIIQYDEDTFDIYSIEDWNGQEVSELWERIAIQQVNRLKEDKDYIDTCFEEAMQERSREVWYDLKKEGY